MVIEKCGVSVANFYRTMTISETRRLNSLSSAHSLFEIDRSIDRLNHKDWLFHVDDGGNYHTYSIPTVVSKKQSSLESTLVIDRSGTKSRWIHSQDLDLF